MKHAVKVVAAVEKLQTLVERVNQWRQHRQSRNNRVPEELWREAAAVAQVLGVNPTAKALHFDYYTLKARLEQAESPTRALVRHTGKTPPGVPRIQQEQTAFVEVQVPTMAQRSATAAMSVELTGSNGRRMHIDVFDPQAMDLVGLASAFWRCKP